MTNNITISEAASKRIAKMLIGEPENSKLRIAVEGGGCNGFQYKFGFDNKVNSDDQIIEKDSVAVVIDDVSAELIAGSEIHFVESLGFSHFEIRNPNSASSCGCGNSFSLKE